jgi:isopentenyl phosphate kinase
MKATFLRPAALAALMLVSGLVQAVRAEPADTAATVKEDARTAGHAVAHGAASVGHTVADDTRTARDTIRDDSKKAGHSVAEGARNLGRTVRDGFKRLKANLTGKPSKPEPKS